MLIFLYPVNVNIFYLNIIIISRLADISVVSYTILIMKYIAQFEYPGEYKMILRDSVQENLYYGLDDFDCKYLKIIQSKFGCLNSFHTIPDHVKMEMTPFKWSREKLMFVLDENKQIIVQLNRLENMVINHSVPFN